MADKNLVFFSSSTQKDLWDLSEVLFFFVLEELCEVSPMSPRLSGIRREISYFNTKPALETLVAGFSKALAGGV